MKDVKFPAQSVLYGWGTAGAFSPLDDGSDVTATARSFSGNLLAAVGPSFLEGVRVPPHRHPFLVHARVRLLGDVRRETTSGT